jgi:hypothetical protein
MNDFDPAPGGEVSFEAFWTVLGVEAECPLSLGRADVWASRRSLACGDHEGCAGSGHCGETCGRADYEVHHSLCPPFNMYRLAREKTCVMRGEKCDYRGDLVGLPDLTQDVAFDHAV